MPNKKKDQDRKRNRKRENGQRTWDAKAIPSGTRKKLKRAKKIHKLRAEGVPVEQWPQGLRRKEAKTIAKLFRPPKGKRIARPPLRHPSPDPEQRARDQRVASSPHHPGGRGSGIDFETNFERSE